MIDPVPPRNSAMAVAASALRAQQSRMRVIAENIANAESTANVAGGQPYRRQIPVFQAREIDGATGVVLAEVRPDAAGFRSEYDPTHPAANAEGYVTRPNVDTLVEAMDMREAQRAYEANLNVIETAHAMETRTLDLLKRYDQAMNPMMAARAYASVQGTASPTAAGAAGGPAAPGFSELLQSVMTDTVQQTRAAESQMAMNVSGQGNLIDVVTAVSSAEASLETVMAVRDQVISAYQEIMRMPI